MKKYSWILFDADGTLFDYEQAEHFALKTSCLEFKISFTPELIAQYGLINANIWREFELGQITATKLRSARFERLFLSMDLNSSALDFSQAYLENLSQSIFLIEGAMEMLAKIQPIKAAIVTNGLTEVQRSRFALSPITKYFEEIIISEEIGQVKPDIAYFDCVFDKIEQPDKNEVLIVGDNLSSDIQGGINYDIDTCWYNPSQKPYSLKATTTYEIKKLSELEKIISNK